MKIRARQIRLLGVVAIAGVLGFTTGQWGEQEEVRYATTELRLREAPRADAPLVLTLPRAARVLVAGCVDGWCTVRYPHTDITGRELESSGFAAQAYLSTIRPLAQTVAPPTRSQSCCKICRKGKACGNTCISRNYTCHKDAGCACNG